MPQNAQMSGGASTPSKASLRAAEPKTDVRWTLVMAAFGALLPGTGAATPPHPQTAEWVDPQFAKPYIDIDEWRNAPVRHRYVHGGFEGTEARFSIYFPPQDRYEKRFFQPIAAMPGSENSAQPKQGEVAITQEGSTIGFAFASGAYLVESNQGKRDKYPTPDRTLTGYRASAAVAQFSRQLAAKMYGPHRPFGYAYGGSGGGFKTISFLESTRGIWDGAVPYVIPTPASLPNALVAQAHALRILERKMPQIVDAIDPGGSGDMYSGLDQKEQAALREITRLGMPPRAWFAYERLGWQAMSGLIDDLLLLDPVYFDRDFWTLPGYLGAPGPSSVAAARFQAAGKVARVISSDELKAMTAAGELAERGVRTTSAAVGANVVPAAFELTQLANVNLKGAVIRFKTGAAAGQHVWINQVIGQLVTIDIGPYAFDHVGSVKAGDEVEIDNSVYLAAQTYHRHQVPSRDFHVFDQFRGADGKPLYPQRPKLVGPWYAERAAGSVQSGRFNGKMILIQTLVDEGAYPWNADWYRRQVIAHQGNRSTDNFRLYFIDNAMHSPPPPGPASARIVSYTGALQQALRDLSAWVEKGTAPPRDSAYRVVDGQVEIPASAAARKGLQPVVALAANGSARTEVLTGQPVQLSGTIDVAPGTGKVVRAEWDFEGTGRYVPAENLRISAGADGRAAVSVTYSFTKPGTYFPALRAASQRFADGTPYAQVENLGRARVIVK